MIPYYSIFMNKQMEKLNPKSQLLLPPKSKIIHRVIIKTKQSKIKTSNKKSIKCIKKEQ